MRFRDIMEGGSSHIDEYLTPHDAHVTSGDIFMFVANYHNIFPFHAIVPGGHAISVARGGRKYLVMATAFAEYDYLTESVKDGVIMVDLEEYVTTYPGLVFYYPATPEIRKKITPEEIISYAMSYKDLPFDLLNPWSNETDSTFCSKLLGHFLEKEDVCPKFNYRHPKWPGEILKLAETCWERPVFVR